MSNHFVVVIVSILNDSLANLDQRYRHQLLHVHPMPEVAPHHVCQDKRAGVSGGLEKLLNDLRVLFGPFLPSRPVAVLCGQGRNESWIVGGSHKSLSLCLGSRSRSIRSALARSSASWSVLPVPSGARFSFCVQRTIRTSSRR